MNETNFKEAAIKVLKHKGCSIVDDDFDGVIVAKDDETLVFVKVQGRVYDGSGFASEPMQREEAEKIAIRFIADYRDESIVRFDLVDIIAVSSDKGFVRHTKNVYGGSLLNESDEPFSRDSN